MPNALVKNADFELVTEFVRPDAKRRLTLGDAVGAGEATAFNIYRNTLGQIVLDPVRAIPTSEAWLWENPAALAAVRKGIKESSRGKTVYLGSFAGDAK
jgi:hypothetical protein